MAPTCQFSYPLNSAHASPPGTFTVYLSWADRALPPNALTSAVTIAIVPKPLLFITGSSFVKASSSAHRFLHERADPCFGGGGQLLQGEGDRPHSAFVEVRLVAEAERRVPRLELVRALEEADDMVVLGVRGHPVPGSRREGWYGMPAYAKDDHVVCFFQSAHKKKQTTWSSLAYAGIPYQVLGERAGALALMTAWSRSAMARSGFGMSAIFVSTSLSPSACFERGPRRASAFSSWTRSFIAARSSSVNPLTALPVTVALFADFRVSVFGLIEPP